MSDIRIQLTEEMAEITWSELTPHAARDAVIIVNESLSLVDVGVAIALDDKMKVANWIAELLVRKPYVEELNNWQQTLDRKFSTLIVQPYVLICPITAS
jgi:hypothetical protein